MTWPITGGGPRKKVYVDGVGATIIAERVEYLDENGKLVTESLRDFTKTAIRKRFASLDDFLKRWKAAERKQAIVEELEAEGLPLDPIAEELGKNLDPFDLICHVAFDKKPLTRRERAENVKKRDVFTKYGPQARAVLDALLAKYADEGVLNLDDANVLRIPPLHCARHTDATHQSIRRPARLRARRTRIAIRALSGSRIAPCPFATSSNPFKISCGKIPVSMATPSASANCAGCFSSRSSTIRIRNLRSSTPITARRFPKKYQWRAWAADPEGITGEELVAFVNGDLFPALKNLAISTKPGDRRRVVRDVFEDAYNYMKSGQLMRQVVNKINGIDFNNLTERQHFGDIYEQILNDLQSAGNAGEYYTPRAVTAFMVDRIDPQARRNPVRPCLRHWRLSDLRTAPHA